MARARAPRRDRAQEENDELRQFCSTVTEENRKLREILQKFSQDDYVSPGLHDSYLLAQQQATSGLISLSTHAPPSFGHDENSRLPTFDR